MKNIKKEKRKKILTILLVSLFAFSGWVYWGNTAIQTTKININNEKIPESFDGFTIVQVSDLHNAEFGNNQSRLLNAIKAVSPDFIAVTGDLIDSNHTDVAKAMEFINGAIEIAPVYYVTGNHEARSDQYAKLKQQMLEAGVIMLEDEGTTIKREGASIRLFGLNDPNFTATDDVYESAAMVDTKLKAMLSKNNEYTILLSHRPELFDIYAENSIDLVLSGHAHGGQVRLPFIGGLVAPNQGFFPKYSEGVHEKEQTKMIVSRGLGNSIIPVRINNRPELVVITLDHKQI
ncbi:metallophosphoesterase [Brevibacillus laterosporus]|uniref:metallophosphoesterase n=1 Tax=Brevibacillus laterosporus TaxID=1465 RepID=UPI00035DEF96|nr:metallophosphoesterase [Brevibacillus laterosporus]ATO51119.1 phosphoesterase [Brevibacillus laterosporus DSM 25]MBG9804053.1 phosphoesterase [Brevibacillus laterosporus]MED2004247.1 metallophosphoesterase [Brevibacillus laterosporus]MED4763464.1 metallophosphoesterase [Brevibacillus laterosporus]TPH14925.1 metallophosphoesterase [Brevibacillus laterosporus]